jgi:hypothetical protein
MSSQKNMKIEFENIIKSKTYNSNTIEDIHKFKTKYKEEEQLKNYESNLILLEIQALNYMGEDNLALDRINENYADVNKTEVGLLKILHTDSLINIKDNENARKLIIDTLTSIPHLTNSEKLTLVYFYTKVNRNNYHDVILNELNEIKLFLGYNSNSSSPQEEISDLYKLNKESSNAYSYLLANIFSLNEKEKHKLINAYLKKEKLAYYRNMAEEWLK